MTGPDTPADDAWLRSLPKAELHVHIEGTLEPELMLTLADKHGVELPYGDADAVRAAYDFEDLQSFLDLYYLGAGVLRDAEDFHALALAYLSRCRDENIRHAELQFDPQTHTARGVPLAVVLDGLTGAMAEAERGWGQSSLLIMSFLRHLPAEAAMATLEAALPFADRITAVGLDSSERGFPPELFSEVFARARAEGFRAVAHAGEEGPPAYVRGALDALRVERIDHGVRAAEDEALLDRLARERIPLTVCPLSNVRLRVFETLADHNLLTLLERGLMVTVNSDDPSYFGGYLTDNFTALNDAFGLTRGQALRLARYSFEASFAPPLQINRWVDEVAAHATHRH